MDVASHTCLVRDITSLFDAGHDLLDKARLLAMACEIRQGRAAVRTNGRSETVKLKREQGVSFETRCALSGQGQALQSMMGYWIVGRWRWHRRRARQQQQRDAFRL
jgi:hypothetical protein